MKKLTRTLILDSNVFIADFKMAGNAFKILRSNIAAVADEIIVPEIVVDEVLGNYRKQLSESAASLSKEVKKFEKLGVKVDYVDVERRCYEYEAAFRRSLKDLECKIAPMPEINVSEMSACVLKRRKPFDAAGAGVQDYIIWLTVLLTLTRDAESSVLFVSMNVHDFSHDDRLHPDLVGDLNALKISVERLNYFTGLQKLVDLEITPNLERLGALREAVSENKVPSLDVPQWLMDAAFELIPADDLASAQFELAADDGDFLVQEVYELVRYEVTNAYIVDSNKSLLDVTAEVKVGFNLCSNFHQYEQSDVVRGYFDEYGDEAPMPLADVNLYATVVLGMNALITNNDFSSAAFELTSLEGDRFTYVYDNHSTGRRRG